MELFYFMVFGALGAVVAALELSKNSKDRINTSPAFNSFKNNYLVVYSLMMGCYYLDKETTKSLRMKLSIVVRAYSGSLELGDPC
ncbi:hypothetical protein Gohar_005780 [Gossypium harknessii]|uniref:Uncharacterized protein n=1 Tax=Gossypium harknessii TaxID=34285 RepID=A0A7J9HAB0_9ROSI|nr:hypothetical protein [Gossypium harknessii]